uniref:Ribosomal RNA processing 1B n=1 Tax=Salvator merianae TaxID=96440 RepID=A0A8D0EEW0_SALMN
MAPAAVASAVQSPEIQFAQRLAANEKRIRDRALKKLRGYITLRSQSSASAFSQDELLKIWKGLFYCMWMQDKPLLQEELSNNISQLIHVIENMDTRHLFVQTFWQTMNREWNGIDRLRLDKFYMLIRMMLRQSFEVLKRNGWNESFVEPFLNMLIKVILHPDGNAPVGIKMHFIDIYLEELAKVGTKELTADQNLRFIEPFCRIVAKTKDHLLLQAIIRGIFETIVDQSPFAIEDLMKELKASGSDDSSEDELSDEENKQTRKDGDSSSKVSLGPKTEDDFLQEADDNIGPVLQFDYQSVADKLFELASRKNTPTFNRKRIYKVVKKFQDLAEGTFPQDDFPEDVSTDEDDDTFSRRKWKRKSGKPLDEAKLGEEENASNGTLTGEQKGSREPLKKRKNRKRKSVPTADLCTPNGSDKEGPVNAEESKEPSLDSESSNCKKRQKKCLTVEASELGSLTTPTDGFNNGSTLKMLTCLVNNVKKQLKKKNSSLQKVPIETGHQNGQANINSQEEPSYLNPLKRKQKTEPEIPAGNSSSGQAVEQPEEKSFTKSKSTILQKVKLKKRQTLRNLVKIRGSKQKIANLKRKRKIKEILNSVEENENEAENKKSRNNEAGAAAGLLKNVKLKAGNDFVKFETTAPPKPAFFRKTKGSITSMQLSKRQSSISKKVTFGLNKNTTAVDPGSLKDFEPVILSGNCSCRSTQE